MSSAMRRIHRLHTCTRMNQTIRTAFRMHRALKVRVSSHLHPLMAARKEAVRSAWMVSTITHRGMTAVLATTLPRLPRSLYMMQRPSVALQDTLVLPSTTRPVDMSEAVLLVTPATTPPTRGKPLVRLARRVNIRVQVRKHASVARRVNIRAQQARQHARVALKDVTRHRVRHHARQTRAHVRMARRPLPTGPEGPCARIITRKIAARAMQDTD